MCILYNFNSPPQVKENELYHLMTSLKLKQKKNSNTIILLMRSVEGLKVIITTMTAEGLVYASRRW